MKTSSTRILTTHAGSLARPPELVALLDAQNDGSVDQDEFDALEIPKEDRERARQALEELQHLAASGEEPFTFPG